MASRLSGNSLFFNDEDIDRDRMGFRGANERAARIRAGKRAVRRDLQKSANKGAADVEKLRKDTATAVEALQQRGQSERNKYTVDAARPEVEGKAAYYTAGAKKIDQEAEQSKSRKTLEDRIIELEIEQLEEERSGSSVDVPVENEEDIMPKTPELDRLLKEAEEDERAKDKLKRRVPGLIGSGQTILDLFR